jgi:Flp pilus assembly protein TadG
VEFTLILPLFLILFIGIIEFAFVFNSALGLNFATRNASLAGAEAGNRVGADCEIVSSIQKSIGPPMNAALIKSVTIFQADQNGLNGSGLKDVWTYSAGAQTPCPTEGNPTQKVDFTSAIGWPSSAGGAQGVRCDVLAGCLQLDGTYKSLDSVGISIVYHYDYHTPLGNFLALPGWGTGFDLTWSNVNRMEPTL